MSGVWEFKDGMVRRQDRPEAEIAKPKVLVHTPSNEVITSYSDLEQHLSALGWERYNGDPSLLAFHKPSTTDLITLPIDFSKFSSIHMYDIVTKNRNMFKIKDM